MNISKILVNGVEVEHLTKEDLLNPKNLISFINGDVISSEKEQVPQHNEWD